MSRKNRISSYEEPDDSLQSVEKIKKSNRSTKGRKQDDWLVDTALASELRQQGMLPGRVLEVHKRHIFVAEEDEQGLPVTENLWFCSIAKRHFQRVHQERNFVVVGDRILFVAAEKEPTKSESESDLPRGVVQHALRRVNQISRQDPLNAGWQHVMLANIDHIAIVASVFHPEVRWGLVDRFLVQAELTGVPSSIILNKVDLLQNSALANKNFLQNYMRRIEIYRKIGYEVIEVCALRPKTTPEAVKQLRRLFRGKVVGISGHSGVGKSSVLNLMRPEFEQVVDENPDIFYKGRHTTSYNSLLQLDIGGYAIDTPGIRSFALDPYPASILTRCFVEFRPYRCKFHECTHDTEPACQIKEALANGAISAERYRSYLGILKGENLREGTVTDAP